MNDDHGVVGKPAAYSLPDALPLNRLHRKAAHRTDGGNCTAFTATYTVEDGRAGDDSVRLASARCVSHVLAKTELWRSIEG